MSSIFLLRSLFFTSNSLVKIKDAMRFRQTTLRKMRGTVEIFMIFCLMFFISMSQIHSNNTDTFASKRDLPLKDGKQKGIAKVQKKMSNEGNDLSGRQRKLQDYRIPFIVHQLWNTRDVPIPMLQYIETWMATHPHWQYWFWTKESQEKFLRERYPKYLPQYLDYELDIQRADMIRFLILYEFGGIYADLDVEVLKPLDPMVNKHPCIVVAEPEEIATVFFSTNQTFITSNALFACRAKHPFLRTVLDELYKTRKETDVMKSTGPLIIDAIVKQFLSDRNDNADEDNKEKDRLYVAPSKYFLPRFGDIHVTIMKKKCSDVFWKPRLCGLQSLEALDYKRLSICKLLEKTEYTKGPTEESYTDHHWVGSWVPKTGWVDSHKNDTAKMAADHTRIDDWFPKLKEVSGILKRLPRQN